MIVNYYATLRLVVGTRQVEYNLPKGGTLRQLVEEMVKRYPGLKREMLDQNGNLHSHIHIYVNGRDRFSWMAHSIPSWIQMIQSRFSLRLAGARLIKNDRVS